MQGFGCFYLRSFLDSSFPAGVTGAAAAVAVAVAAGGGGGLVLLGTLVTTKTVLRLTV